MLLQHYKLQIWSKIRAALCDIFWTGDETSFYNKPLNFTINGGGEAVFWH